MPALSIQIPYPIFSDRDGQPLENGYVWIGQPYLDPQTNPVQVYLDDALTIPVAQPLRTIGGYVSNSGTPAQLYINGVNFSIRVQDNKGTLVYYFPDGSGINPDAAGVTYNPGPDSLLLPGGPISVKAALDEITDDETGSSVVGFLQAGTGAVTRTAQSKMRDVVSVLDFGAVGDGVTDDSAAFIAARTAAAGKRIYVPAGTYKLNSVVSSSEDLILEGDGPSTILDFTGTITGGNYALEAIGTATQIQNLSGTQTVGTNTVTFASAPSLAIGDVFVIFNPTSSSWSGFRSNYFAGEWCEVESISGSVVTVRNQLYDTYAAANVDVYKITGPKVTLRNFDIRGTTVLGLITTTLCIAPLVENVKASHANNSIVYFDRCFKPTVINPDMSNVGDLGDDYGIAIGNSQHAKVIGGNVYARRHAVTHGGNAEVCAVPNRDSRVIGSTLKNDINSSTFAADFHGNTEDSSFIDCTIYGGASWQGKDVEYVNCTITGDVGGRVMYSAEIKGGRFGLRGCKLITHVNPQPGGRGIVDVGGNNSAITADTVLPCLFSVTDCEVYGRNLTSLTSFFIAKNNGSTQFLNFNISGVAANLDQLGQVLLTQLVSGTASSAYIIVDSLVNFPSGVLLHNAIGAAYRDFPHRLQKQTGSEALTATSGTNVTLGTSVNFKYVYPRVPSAQATSVGGFAGNVMALAGFSDLTNLALRPALYSADATNWAATVARPVYWTASIDEV